MNDNRACKQKLYGSKAWKDCRESYMKSVQYLCERCLKNGLNVPADVVHHKIRITPQNVNNPNIALNFANLEALCVNCHAAEHSTHVKRYYVDEMGRVIIKKDQ